MDSLVEIQAQCYNDSNEWFDVDREPDQKLSNNLPYMTLALTGEAGELANIVKKLQRGDLELADADVLHALCNEIVDVFIYVCNVANIMNLNLGEAYSQKRQFNVERFGKHQGAESGDSDGVDRGLRAVPDEPVGQGED